MNTTIKIKYTKELDSVTERKILQLKGALIAEKFTDIIHLDEDGQDSYISYFSTDSRDIAVEFIERYIRNEMLEGHATLINQ